MSASSTRVAVAAAVLLLAFAGGLSWQRMRPSSSAHVEMLASRPETARGASEAAIPSAAATRSVSPSPDTGLSRPSAAAARDDARELSSASGSSPREGIAAPSFDVVRVEPSGDALLAGRSRPNSTVALLDRGSVVAEIKADAGGTFVMIPPSLKPGDYALSLRDGQGADARESRQSVVVSVPATKKQQVMVALAEPGKATTLISEPPDLAIPATAAIASQAAALPAKLAIRSVELENGSGLFASGTAPPGTDIRVYLNDSRVADVVAAETGAWTLKVRKGLAAGRYAVRVDSLKPDRGVGARVEVPFEVPVAPAAERTLAGALPTAAPATPASGADASPASEASVREPRVAQVMSANVVVEELQTELVNHGDNLWRISRKRLGHGTRYTEIYAANLAQIRDPKLVYPGQVFVLPHD